MMEPIPSIEVITKPMKDPYMLRACRTCLATEAKLFDLHENGFADSLGSIAGTPVSLTDGLPQYICYYCIALLKKSSEFRLQCRKAHFFLQDTLLQKLEATTECISCLDRTHFAKPLTVAKVFVDSKYWDSNGFPIDFKYDEPTAVPEMSDIKVEALLLDETDNDDQMDNCDDHFDYDHLDNDDMMKTDDKSEKELDDVNDSNEGIMDIIQICEKKKDKKKKSSTKKKERTKRERKVVKVAKERKIAQKKEPVSKRKKENNLSADGITITTHNKYNQKLEEDFVMFSKMYNVEVVFLTKEQQQKNVEDRKNSKQYKNSLFSCDLCFKGFMSEQAYKRHMKGHDPSRGNLECDVCHYRFNNKQTMYGHMQHHKREYICKICNQLNKSTSRAKLHFKWHEGQKFECTYCNKKFNFKSTHVNHVRENHAVVTCNVCGGTLEGTNALAKHKAEMHSKITQCPTCEIEFCSVEALNSHRSTEDGCNTEMRPCLACGLNFLTPDELDRHLLEAKHKELIFKCQSFQCSATFTSERKLGAHRSVIHGERQPRGEYPRVRRPPAPPAAGAHLMCEFCAKSYPTAVQLKYHQRVHTDEKPYRCPLCVKSFRTLAGLKVHVNTHTGERPFKCRLCPETFKSYSQKYKHRLMVHTKERPHKCHMCDKSYFVSCDLKMHIQFAHMHVPRPHRNRNRNKNICK